MVKVDLYDDDDILVDTIFCEDTEYLPYEVERYCFENKLCIGYYQAYHLGSVYDSSDLPF